MLFNSVEYILLLFSSLIAYWACPWLKVRQWIIFVSSVYFYMSWSRTFVVMLLALIGINWLIGYFLAKDGRRRWLVLACIINLSLLAWFKYANFFIENLLEIAHLAGAEKDAPHLSIILPLGISFYVFELISYLADIYRRRIGHERSLLVFSLFVLFFPHLIAGPICRATQFVPQVKQLQTFTSSQFYNGLYLFLCGFALKCGIADGVAPFVNVIFNAPASYSGFDNLMGALGFGIQILCDFWGYSLMALGAALLFGYVLPPNFNAPYAALSIRDFWRRWHMTLSNWLRDYLYIALGGSRESAGWKVQRNLVITMLLGGLWHGASWNFIVWGAIHGGALAINRWFESAPLPASLKQIFTARPVAWLLTMAVVFTGWVFFRTHHFHEAAVMLERIVTPSTDWAASRLAPMFFELMLLYPLLQWLVHRTTFDYDMAAQSMRKQVVIVVALSIFALIYYIDGNEFIYFQF